ncbi:MAG: lysine--tRNA ligase [Candidatus Babeliales bacterium]
MTKKLESTTPVHEEHSGQEHEMRVEKVKKLRAMGIEPWPAAKEVNATCAQMIAEFSDEKESREYLLSGRVVAKREHGKTSFATIQDRTGRVQLYIRQDVLGEKAYDLFDHYIDLGDIIWCKGTSFRTKMGEITLKVTDFTLLSKSLHPLPEKFHGLTDTETKYRQRYLDLISNEESRAKFIARSRIIKSIRQYLNDHDFLEVETPMLHPIAGGAAARPFITHHNALDSNFYLRIAPELYLKRLVVGGLERVYEINRNFRNEGISTRHNPEFTMLEFYMAHQEYHYIMGFVEELLRTVVREGSGKLQVQYGEHVIDFEKPFERISVTDAVLKYTDLTPKDISESSIDATIKKHEVPLAHAKATLSEKIYAIFEELVESKLIQPTFVIDYPIEVSPLSKRDFQNPAIAARFELFIGGMEISNGFNELNDPIDQAGRFKQQLEAHAAGDEEAHQYDADFVLALEHALPPTVGVGIGIDRLTMLVTNTTSIKDVILFPTLKKKES